MNSLGYFDKPNDKMARIKVGNNCFIGSRSTIMMGVTIGDNVIIGANSVVSKDIPSNSVAAGMPAKVICTIDEYCKKIENEDNSIHQPLWQVMIKENS